MLSTTASALPQASRPQRPRPCPVITTEFTVTIDPATVALRGPKGDPAAIVRSLQTAIRQSFQGNLPLVTLLSGRWSSQLSSNFVLTFAGQPSNNAVFRLRTVLLSPFQPGVSLVPQRGYTRVAVHSVPIVLDEQGSRPSSDALASELASNEACQGLCIINPPKWLWSMIEPEKAQSSSIFSLLDEDGSRLAYLTKSPLYLFGAPCPVKLFNSLPLVPQCKRCYRLGHSVDCCRQPKGVIICHICGSCHAAKDHAFHCPIANRHTTLTCSCMPQCINCCATHLPAAGHLALDLACPLRKKYWRKSNQSGASSNEEINQHMVVDALGPSSLVPSSQPDMQAAFHPGSQVWIDDLPPPPIPRSAPPAIAALLEDRAK